LAAALRRHDLSALRKRGFMALCRAWGYRSDVWRDVRVARAAAATARADARGGAGAAPARRRPTHTPTPPAPGALALCAPPPSPLGGGVDSHLSGLLPAPQALPPPPLALTSPARTLPPPVPAAVLLARDLNPLVSRFVAAVWFPSVLDATLREPHAPLATLNAAASSAVAALARALRARTLHHAAALRAAARALAVSLSVSMPSSSAASASAAATSSRTTPASQLCAAAAPPLAEASLARALLMAHAMSAALADASSPVGGVCTLLARPLSSPERAHFCDAFAAVHAVQSFLTRAAAALAAARAGAPAGTYLEAGVVVCEQLGALLGALAEANEARVAAFAARPRHAAPLGWRGTFFFSRLAADDRWWEGGGGSGGMSGGAGGGGGDAAGDGGGAVVRAVIAAAREEGTHFGAGHAPLLAH
jgi:hypothetical protein